MWVIGKLEETQLEGSAREVGSYVEKRGAEDIRVALAKLGKEIGEDPQSASMNENLQFAICCGSRKTSWRQSGKATRGLKTSR